MFTQAKFRGGYNLKFISAILFAVTFLVGGFFVASTAFAETVADQIDQYTSNDGNFTRSPTAGTGSTVSQTTNPDGSVVMNINNATGGADSGFYTEPMKLGDVKSVTVIGSGPYGVNIWLDKNTYNDTTTNGKFFKWNSNGNVFISTDGDGFFSEGSSVPNGNGILTINDSSSFHSYAEDVAPYSPSKTLAELKVLYSDKYVTFWVGTTIVSGGGTQSATITAFNVVKPGELAPSTFGVMDFSEVIGYSGEFNLTDATLADATSMVVKLYSENTLLQTNTSTGKLGIDYATGHIFSAPFDVMGTFNYGTDGYWTNVREAQYGQTLVPTKVVATVTLANGKVVTAESTNPPTGNLTIISNAGTLAAQDFGVVNYDVGGNLGWNKGYTAGFGLTDVTLAGATSVVVKLYSGATEDTLLQTNTATAKFGTDVTGVQFSSLFDVSGTFNYATDGYWTNVRQTQYGQSIPATRVVATVTLANDKVVTATNTTLTGDATTIYPVSETLTFNSAGGSAVTAITQNFGTAVTAPANPTKAGYTFTAWSPAFPVTMPVSETLTATWTANGNGGGGSGGGSSTIPAVPAKVTTPDGCEAGNKFSTTTGRNCNAATPAVPAGKVLGAEKFNFTILVKNGSKGSEIIELQNFLNTLGYTLVADGKFGPKTKGAVIKFQLANKLVGDGVVGAKTRAVLNK